MCKTCTDKKVEWRFGELTFPPEIWSDTTVNKLIMTQTVPHWQTTAIMKDMVMLMLMNIRALTTMDDRQLEDLEYIWKAFFYLNQITKLIWYQILPIIVI